jgi:hypothetical protein
MSPIFEPDFTKVDANIPTYEKGRYQVKVKSTKPFVRKSEDRATGQEKTLVGVRVGFEMIGAFDPATGKLDKSEIGGKSVSSYTIWLHTEGGWQFAKPFLMAAAGFNVREQEDEANRKFFAKNKWHVKGDPGDDAPEMGNGYSKILDRIVDVNLDISSSEGSEGQIYKNQEFGGWTPVE